MVKIGQDEVAAARVFWRAPGVVFLIWTCVGAVVMAFGIQESSIESAGLPGWLAAAAVQILRLSDALWICLAALLVAGHEMARRGVGITLGAFALIAVISGLAEWVGATTGLLFGNYEYTTRFGILIGGVLPFTIPLAWVIVLTGAARIPLIERIPSLPLRCLAIAAVATLTDLNLEPVAIHVREYWVWSDAAGEHLAWAPLSNYVTWFVLSAVLAFPLAIRSRKSVVPPPQLPRLAHPAVVLLLMNGLFLAANLGLWLRLP